MLEAPAILRLFALVPLLLVSAGCGSADDLNSPTAKRLRAVAAIYQDYAVAKGHGPRSREELLAHVALQPEFVLRSYGVELTDAAELLTSERDGQELTIRYELPVSHTGQGRGPILAHEATGKNGRRLAAFQNLTVDILGEEEFTQAIAGR